MLIDFKLSQTSIVLRVKLRDSTSSSGAGLTGLLFSSSGLRVSTIADNESAATAYTQAGSTIETITTLGTYAAPTATKCRFKEVDATNHPGMYELQIADARFAVASAKSVLISINGATNLAQCDVLVPLRTFDPYVAGGKAPATLAAADVSGNLPADAKAINAVATTSVTTVNANVGTTQPVNFTGSAAAALIKVDVQDFGGTAGTFTGGKPAVLDSGGNSFTYTAPPTTAAIATALLTDLTASADFNTAGSFGKLIKDNLDTNVGSRLATSGYTAPDNADILLIKAKTDNLPASPAAVGSAMTLDLTQTVTQANVSADTTVTVGKAMLSARAQAAGAWTVSGTTLTLKNPDGTTFRTFTLDSSSAPTSRT